MSLHKKSSRGMFHWKYGLPHTDTRVIQLAGNTLTNDNTFITMGFLSFSNVEKSAVRHIAIKVSERVKALARTHGL